MQPCLVSAGRQRNEEFVPAQPDTARLNLQRIATTAAGWFLALAVSACGISVNAQDSRHSSVSKTGAEGNIWTIGIYTGPSPFQLSAPSNVKNPVLTGADVTDMKDLNVDTVAHPFLLATGSRYYVFFTAKDLKADKGGIGLAESEDGFEWKFRRTVIREQFVLCHPCVFKWGNDYWMVPEAHTETFCQAVPRHRLSGPVEVRRRSGKRGPLYQPHRDAVQGHVVAVYFGARQRHPQAVLRA